MLRNILNNNLIRSQRIFAQNLYSPAALGMENYIEARKRVQNQFGSSEEKFKEKIKEVLTKDDGGTMIFTEDLKNMVHIATSKSDIQAIETMIKKFNSQNKELRFGNFIFGPVVLRMLHHLKETEVAYQNFKNPELKGFFDQIISYHIILDLLFKEGRYQDVIDLFENIKSRQIQGGKYPKHCVVLVFGSCYKLNTPESFDYCKKLWHELQVVGHLPMRKAATFAAGLAYKQGHPNIAIEILSTIKDQQYLTVRNLKALSYAEIGRVEDSIKILKSVLEYDNPLRTKRSFISEVIDKIKAAIARDNKKELEVEFNKIEKILKENNHINNDTLDDILCTAVLTTSLNNNPNNNERPDRAFVSASFDRNRQNKSFPRGQNQYRERQGLSDHNH